MKKLLSLAIITLVSLTIIAGCGSKDKVQVGDVISVMYTATFSDGTVFDENTEQTPLMFTVGSKQVIAGLDEAVVGMKVGKSKTVTVVPEKGYGILYDERLVQKIGKIIFDKIGIVPEIGTTQELDQLVGIVKDIETDKDGYEFVIFDINPRQTRDTVTYEITVLAKADTSKN